VEAFFLRPLSGVKYAGIGERLPAYPGPAGTRKSHSALPRIETFLGSLASLLWSSRGEECEESWETCVRDAVLGGRAAGPFLLIGDKLYVDVFEGLLEVGALEEYFELLRVSAGDPLELLDVQRWKEKKVRELEEEGKLIRKDYFVASRTGVALDPLTKTTGHGAVRGMIYSINVGWVDEVRRGARLVYLADLSGEVKDVLSSLVSKTIKVGPKDSYFEFEVRGADLGGVRCEGESGVVISEAPLEEHAGLGDVEGHPLLDGYLTVNFASYGLPPRRSPPRPALKAGTVVRRFRNGAVVRVLDRCGLERVKESLLGAR